MRCEAVNGRVRGERPDAYGAVGAASDEGGVTHLELADERSVALEDGKTDSMVREERKELVEDLRRKDLRRKVEVEKTKMKKMRVENLEEKNKEEKNREEKKKEKTSRSRHKRGKVDLPVMWIPYPNARVKAPRGNSLPIECNGVNLAVVALESS